jgi:hypothetical protein
MTMQKLCMAISLFVRPLLNMSRFSQNNYGDHISISVEFAWHVAERRGHYTSQRKKPFKSRLRVFQKRILMHLRRNWFVAEDTQTASGTLDSVAHQCRAKYNLTSHRTIGDLHLVSLCSRQGAQVQAAGDGSFLHGHNVIEVKHLARPDGSTALVLHTGME